MAQADQEARRHFGIYVITVDILRLPSPDVFFHGAPKDLVMPIIHKTKRLRVVLVQVVQHAGVHIAGNLVEKPDQLQFCLDGVFAGGLGLLNDVLHL